MRQWFTAIWSHVIYAQPLQWIPRFWTWWPFWKLVLCVAVGHPQSRIKWGRTWQNMIWDCPNLWYTTACQWLIMIFVLTNGQKFGSCPMFRPTHLALSAEAPSKAAAVAMTFGDSLWQGNLKSGPKSKVEIKMASMLMDIHCFLPEYMCWHFQCCHEFAAAIDEPARAKIVDMLFL